MVGEPAPGAELQKPISSKDPENVPQEIQEANFHFMDALRASRSGNGDFFVDLGKRAESVKFLRADSQAIFLKEGRKKPESNQFDYVVFTRLGPKIMTNPEVDFRNIPHFPDSGAYVRRPEHFSGVTKPDIALKFGGKYVPMRDVVSEADKDFVREALVNSVIAGKKGLHERDVAITRRIIEEQGKAGPKKSTEKDMIEEMSAFVTETSSAANVLRSPRPH